MTTDQGDERRAPTDEEIDAWAGEEEFFLFAGPEEVRDIVRSALQKWAAQPVAQEAIPAGYALISIDALRAWGKLDEVRDACKYPLAAPKPSQGALPNPGSPEASAMMDSLLAEYQYPSNPKNAARAGYEAARRMLSTPHHPASAEAGKGVGAWVAAANEWQRSIDGMSITKSDPPLEIIRTILQSDRARRVAPSESVAVSGEVSEEQIDAVWDGLPGVKIHNEATSRGLKTEVLLRRYFAKAVLALAKTVK